VEFSLPISPDASRTFRISKLFNLGSRGLFGPGEFLGAWIGLDFNLLSAAETQEFL
jgi:hypothetical protein